MAAVGISRNIPGSVSTCAAKNARIASRPANHPGSGGISSTASLRSSSASASASAFSKAAANRSSAARCPGSFGSAVSSSAGSARASWARARRSPLLTAVVVVPSSPATSAAGHPSTSRRISMARCRAGRYCCAATSASRIPARAATALAGSSPAPASSASGTGCSHGTSGAGTSAMSGSAAGPASPDGIGRRPRRSSAVRHALVAIRYSQVRTEDRPSNPPNDRHARRYVSCTRSSASSTDPSIR